MMEYFSMQTEDFFINLIILFFSIFILLIIQNIIFVFSIGWPLPATVWLIRWNKRHFSHQSRSQPSQTSIWRKKLYFDFSAFRNHPLLWIYGSSILITLSAEFRLHNEMINWQWVERMESTLAIAMSSLSLSSSGESALKLLQNYVVGDAHSPPTRPRLYWIRINLILDLCLRGNTAEFKPSFFLFVTCQWCLSVFSYEFCYFNIR